MIENDKQYEITRQWLHKFQQAMTEVDSEKDIIFKDLLKSAYHHQCQDLIEQLREYEQRKSSPGSRALGDE